MQNDPRHDEMAESAALHMRNSKRTLARRDTKEAAQNAEYRAHLEKIKAAVAAWRANQSA